MNRNITATILLVLALGVYMTFTRTKVAEVKAVQEVNKQYLTAIENADRLIKERDKVRDQYNQISTTDQQRLNLMLPNTVDNIRLIIDLNSVALRHGFSLRNIKATASSESQRPSSNPSTFDASGDPYASGYIASHVLDTVTVSFSVSAPYQQFIDFMKALESNLRLMDLVKLSVSVNDDGVYDFGVELKTYWLRQQ